VVSRRIRSRCLRPSVYVRTIRTEKRATRRSRAQPVWRALKAPRARQLLPRHARQMLRDRSEARNRQRCYWRRKCKSENASVSPREQPRKKDERGATEHYWRAASNLDRSDYAKPPSTAKVTIRIAWDIARFEQEVQKSLCTNASRNLGTPSPKPGSASLQTPPAAGLNLAPARDSRSTVVMPPHCFC
jgi:hypothetical protein